MIAIATDLQQIKDYWNKKYPNIYVSLYSNEAGNKYFGKMIASESSLNLNADTIGELITQGENFLRLVT